MQGSEHCQGGLGCWLPVRAGVFLRAQGRAPGGRKGPCHVMGKPFSVLLGLGSGPGAGDQGDKRKAGCTPRTRGGGGRGLGCCLHTCLHWDRASRGVEELTASRGSQVFCLGKSTQDLAPWGMRELGSTPRDAFVCLQSRPDYISSLILRSGACALPWSSLCPAGNHGLTGCHSLDLGSLLGL